MSKQHKDITLSSWSELNIYEQMANIGSEVIRSINWKNKKNIRFSRNSIERGLELLGLTIADKKNKKHLKELTRLWEILVDYFYYTNSYSSSDRSWEKYFLAFNYAARIGK